MNSRLPTEEERTLDQKLSGVLAADVAATLGLEPAPEEEESKKDKKKKKKKKKKAEERERRELLEQMDAEHPRLDGTPLAPTPEKVKEEAKAIAEDPKAHKSLQLQSWLKPVSRTLENHRVLAAHKSSFLIAINCLMLSIAAHSLYRGIEAGPLQWALLPLALTNVLSLTFAILSAQVRTTVTALDELWLAPNDDYAPAVAALLQDKQKVYETLSSDLHLMGADLTHRQNHLRTAYNVLLGGVAASTCLFAVCVALATRN